MIATAMISTPMIAMAARVAGSILHIIGVREQMGLGHRVELEGQRHDIGWVAAIAGREMPLDEIRQPQRQSHRRNPRLQPHIEIAA